MPEISRRRFCIAAAHALAGLLVSPALSYCAPRPKEFPLSFFHTHTEEWLEILHTPGQCCSAEQRKINTFLRDFRTGEVRPIDPALLDIISKIQSTTGSRGTIEIISGYRSPQTNSFLHNRSSGVATHSLHLEGRAVDIRITDLPTRKLRECAIALQTGGVGYYAASDFVHLDTGRFRTW